MTKLPTLQERHKIPILSSTCSTCPQPSYVSQCCGALTYKLRTLTFLVSFPNQIFRGSLCPTCEKFGLGMKLKKFQACSCHVTVAYVPTSSGTTAFLHKPHVTDQDHPLPHHSSTTFLPNHTYTNSLPHPS